MLLPTDPTVRMISDEPLPSRPGHLIRRAQQIAVSIFLEETAGNDLTPVQYAALVAIRNNPGIDATRLSQIVAFDRSTLGSVLERLEGKGLITRTAAADDRRVKLLDLTGTGAELVTRIAPSVRRTQDRILAPLTPEDRHTFMVLLAQLVDVNNTASRVPLGTPAKR